ncbi:MAG: T9SS type A sorting domain-containing protein [Ignavibacteria bacterium]|jgi:hypothetical protein|nr:T9SS type A sorting domain-containing protein [Ignavibacteria bacterium]
MKKNPQFILLFLLLTLPTFAYNGVWEEKHPELNGEIPGPRYMYGLAPIGERKALLLNGLGNGNPSAYNDTWLYDYDLDKWTKVECNVKPDTYFANTGFPMMAQVSKNRVLARSYNKQLERFNYIFDLDSMQWYQLEGVPQPGVTPDGYYATMINFKENVAMLYGIAYQTGMNQTWLATMDTTKSLYDSAVITWQKVSDDAIEEGPGTWHGYNLEFPRLANIGDEEILFRPRYKYYDGYNGNGKYFWYFCNTYKWRKLEDDRGLLDNFRNPYAPLLSNFVLDCSRLMTYDILLPALDVLNADRDYVKMFFLDTIAQLPYRDKTKGVKLADGIVMIFGGDGGKLLNDTWVFRLTDTLSIIEEITDTNNIFFNDNILILKDIERLELYDIMGNLISKYERPLNTTIDLTPLSKGFYLIRYYDGKKIINKKIIKH